MLSQKSDPRQWETLDKLFPKAEKRCCVLAHVNDKIKWTRICHAECCIPVFPFTNRPRVPDGCFLLSEVENHSQSLVHTRKLKLISDFAESEDNISGKYSSVFNTNALSPSSRRWVKIPFLCHPKALPLHTVNLCCILFSGSSFVDILVEFHNGGLRPRNPIGNRVSLGACRDRNGDVETISSSWLFIPKIL